MSDETTPQDDEAMPPASAGSQPVAWAVAPRVEDEIDCEFVYSDQQEAAAVASGYGGVVVPLYRHPPTAVTDDT